MARLLEQRKRFTKNAIYDAAIGILTHEGFDAMTMERVAEVAGVAKGSVYNYFPNKQELARFVFTNTIDPLAETIEGIANRDLPALEKLRQILRTWFQYVNEHRGVVNMLFNDHAFQKLLKMVDPPPRNKPIGRFDAIIRQGIEEGVFRAVDAREYARLLFVVVCETCDEHVARQETWGIEDSVDLVMDFFLHGAGK